MSEDQINNIIPAIMEQMESDQENESDKLYAYWQESTPEQKEVIDNVMMYLTGWTFPTILEKAKDM